MEDVKEVLRDLICIMDLIYQIVNVNLWKCAYLPMVY